MGHRGAFSSSLSRLSLPGERLDQGEVELEPRRVRKRAQLGPGAAGPFQQRGLPLGRNPNSGVLVSFLPVTLATFVF